MAPLLAARVFFTEDDPENLDNVQWTYLGIAIFVFLLAVVFFFAPLPEITDADMALQGEESAGLTGYADKPFRKQYKLFFGVLAQFCYVGAQVGIAGKLKRLLRYIYTELTPAQQTSSSFRMKAQALPTLRHPIDLLSHKESSPLVVSWPPA